MVRHHEDGTWGTATNLDLSFHRGLALRPEVVQEEVLLPLRAFGCIRLQLQQAGLAESHMLGRTVSRIAVSGISLLVG